jgi:hypothetical protein
MTTNDLLTTFNNMLNSRVTAQQANSQARKDESALLNAIREAGCEILAIDTGQEDIGIVYECGQIVKKKIKILKIETQSSTEK